MKNTDYTFAYWREVYRKVFSVSLRAGRRPAKQSNFSNNLLVDVGLVMILALGLTSVGHAETTNEVKKEAKGDKEEITDLSVKKEIEGEVSAVDKHGIAVVFKRDLMKGTESEIYIPLEKENIKMVHKRKIEDIQVGDIVKVEYELLTEETKEGSSSRFNAQSITFLKPAQKKPLPTESIEPVEESEEEELPFKGIQ